MERNFPDDLFEGLSGPQREERLTLLRWLAARGVGLEHLRDAIRDGRLPLLPTELILTRSCRYTLAEAASESGLSPEFIARAWRAAGIAVPGPGEAVLDDEDLEAVKFARQVVDAGFSEDVYVEISRVVGRGAAPTAETLVQVSIERFLDPSQSEAGFAMRLQEIADQLEPLLPLLLAFPVRMHLRAAIRNHALERRGEDVIALSGTRRMAVSFVDLVGFTALSETLSVTEASGVATTLERLAANVAEPPVRLVKLIGDAAMLVSDEPAALVNALLQLAASAEREDGIPPLKIGAASGEVAARAGDVYGPAVNLASRLSDAAKPGQLLCSRELGELLRDSHRVHTHSAVAIKGIGSYRPAEILSTPAREHP